MLNFAIIGFGGLGKVHFRNLKEVMGVEKDINLKIALKARDFLSAMGYRVLMTRESDSALASNKKADMHARLDLIRQNPDSVFVSIHQNYFSQSKYFGAQMFYGNGERSKKLAEIFQQNFCLNEI